MTVQKPYSEIVAQAERAVAAVKDPELRRAAFEKILDDLLSGARGSKNRETKLLMAGAQAARSRRIHPHQSKPKRARGGPQAYVSELIAEGFFKKPKSISEVKAELENRGHHIPITSLSGPLQKLCQAKQLRRQKVNGEDKKKTFAYSNW